MVVVMVVVVFLVFHLLCRAGNHKRILLILSHLLAECPVGPASVMSLTEARSVAAPKTVHTLNSLLRHFSSA